MKRLARVTADRGATLTARFPARQCEHTRLRLPPFQEAGPPQGRACVGSVRQRWPAACRRLGGATGSGGSSHSIGSGRRASAWAITSSTSATGDQLQVLLHVVRDFRQVLLVLLRDEHGGDPGPQRRQQLLLQAADRQHPAAQRDLAGHRDVAAHRNAGQDRHDRGRHRDAGRRPVLRRGTLRHVHVDVALLEQRRLDAEAGSTRLRT